MSVRASVVIPTYNRRDLLRLTLESLVSQDAPRAQFEVIVVDDGSTDGTSELVAGFVDRVRLTCVRQEHRGYRVARARNLGIERAGGDTIVFVDSGVLLSRRFVSAHCAAQSRMGDTPAVVIGYVHAYDFNIRSTALVGLLDRGVGDVDGAIAALQRSNDARDIRERLYVAVNDQIGVLPAPWSLFWTTNVSAPRRLLIEVGGFDEEFVKWGVEDVELGYRLWRKGGRFDLSREAAGIHYPHARDNAANQRAHEENRRLFFRKHPALETEAFLASDPLSFNVELQQYRSGEVSRSSLWKRRMEANKLEAAAGVLSGRGDVVFGFRDGRLLGLCGSRAGIEADATMVDAARRQHPEVDAHARLGVLTPFRDGQFGTCLLGGAALRVPRRWLLAMMREAARVASATYGLLLDPDDVTDSKDGVVRERQGVSPLCAGVGLYELPRAPAVGARNQVTSK